MRKLKRISIYATIAMAATSAMAVDWNGSEDTDWFNGNNWVGGVVPNGAAARFPSGGTAVIADGEAAVQDIYHYGMGTVTVEGSSESSKGIIKIGVAGDRISFGDATQTGEAVLHLKENSLISMMEGGRTGSGFSYKAVRASIAIGDFGNARLIIDQGASLEMAYEASQIFTSDCDKRGLLVIGRNGRADGTGSTGIADVYGNIKVSNIKVGLSAGSTGIMTVYDGATIDSAYLLQIGVMGGNATLDGGRGTLNIKGGTIKAAEISVGSHALTSGSTGDSGISAGTGVLNMEAGTLTATSKTFIAENGIGTFNMSGGSADLKALVIGNAKTHTTIAAQGEFNITGGNVIATTAVLGSGANTVGKVDLSGGSFAASSTLTIGNNGTGEFYVSGNGTLTAEAIRIGYGSTGNGLLEIQKQTGSIYKNNGTTLTAISGGTTGKGIVRFDYAGSMDFANVMSGNNLKVEHVNSAVTTLSGASSYAGGTLLSAGTIIAANSKALGNGKLEVKDGVLKTNQSAISTGSIELSSGGVNFIDDSATTTTLTSDFTMTGGTYSIDILALDSFDVIAAAGGTITISNGVLALKGYDGFEGVLDVEAYRYKIFESGNAIAPHGLTITGYDTSSWFADIDSDGYLFFTQTIPEPGTFAAAFGALALALAAYRRRK